MTNFIINNIFKKYIKKLSLISNNPVLDLEQLLIYVLKKTKLWLLLNFNNVLILNAKLVKKFYHLLNRRIKGEPLEYIFEQCQFWSMNLKIKKPMFIPRNETELIVTKILNLLDNKQQQYILEFGTGTGAISLAINKEYNNKHKITAIDNDMLSINCAKYNAYLLNVKNINFILLNWFKPFMFNIKYNFIISNPPYVDYKDLFYNDLGNHYESTTSTLSLSNGLHDIFHIIYYSNKLYLKKGGWLILEHGWYQANFIHKFLYLNNFINICTYKDYSYYSRITLGKKV